MEKTKVIVTIHKSKVELKSGESIHEFTRDLGDAAREYVKEALGLGDNDDSYCYVDEIFGDYVVVYAYIDGDGSTYYAFPYERNIESDSYTFGTLTEVERKTSFVLKNPVTDVIKQVCGDWIEKSLWKGVL